MSGSYQFDLSALLCASVVQGLEVGKSPNLYQERRNEKLNAYVSHWLAYIQRLPG